MMLYIDGDALPNLLKPILIKAINRIQLETVVVSNKHVNIGKSRLITYQYVAAGLDEADNHIVECIQAGDIVITADIPLADRAITKKAHAIDHRGKLFTTENIKQHLAMRNLMQEIRDSGEMTKGPPPFTAKDAQEFANKLNQLLSKHG
jgi:uncharacterized protein YaiI (UPF0178 family)